MIAGLALVAALLQTPAATPQTPAPAAPAAPAPRRAPAAPATLDVRVTDRTGTPEEGVTVTLEGPASREGLTNASGVIQFRTLGAGTYRVRATHESFVTLEKEVTVRAGAAPSPIEFALSFAPPPPPPPAPPTPPPAAPASTPTPAVKAGDSRVLSIADLAEKSLSGRDPFKWFPVACSGLNATQMLVLRETLATPANPMVDEMLYVVAGEATLSLNGRDQVIGSGWYAMVPRGMPHTLTRRGRNPAIVLSTLGGEPCTGK
jgi:mannose-6-phosphate isomerase-like protein (cupin superfamily)